MLTEKWIEDHRPEIEDLYDALLNEVACPADEGDHHILTAHSDDDGGISTAIRTGMERDADGEVELPHVLALIAAEIASGTPLALILCTFHKNEISQPLPNGVKIPVKTVRGWHFDGAALQPVDEQAMFAVHCIDSETGDPIPPEHGVRYADAWPAPSVRPLSTQP